jgi:hypothetical protein
LNQRDFFDHLLDKTGITTTVINSSSTFNAKRLPYTEYNFRKPTIGRYVFPQEICCELDIHNSRELLVDWRTINRTAIDFIDYKQYKLGRYIGRIPINLYDSGRGIHLNIFTSNMVDYADKNGVKPRELAKGIWSFLNFKSDNTDNCLLNRRQNSVIRACGGYNPKSKSYKSFIPTEYQEKKFFKLNEVVYPDIKLWKVPVPLMKKCVRKIKLMELLKKMQVIEPPTGKLMSLPCFKNIVNAELPATGKSVRNLLAATITYCVLHDTGNEELVKKYIDLYVSNIHKVDSDFPDSSSQYGWINTINRDGLKNWSFDCGRIKHFQRILNKLGYNIVLCNNCKGG